MFSRKLSREGKRLRVSIANTTDPGMRRLTKAKRAWSSWFSDPLFWPVTIAALLGGYLIAWAEMMWRGM